MLHEVTCCRWSPCLIYNYNLMSYESCCYYLHFKTLSMPRNFPLPAEHCILTNWKRDT